MRRLLLILLVLIPVSSFAEDLPRADRDREARARHFVLTARHTLRPNEQAELAAEGVEIQHVLPDNRYIVRADGVAGIANDPRVASIEPFAPTRKIASSAYREAARGRAFARVRLIFHDDVSFEDAQRAIERIGGTVDATLANDFPLPHRLVARIPSASLGDLAADDRVFAVYGRPLKIAPVNANAAAESHVTPLYSAPYDLSGAGVTVSEFEFAQVDAGHPEFGGRVTNHVTSTDAGSAQHATHVAGTIMASGIQPLAKGMAPAATLHVFDVSQDWSVVLSNKQNQLPALGVVSDNNSWGFQIGWQETPSGWVWFDSLDAFGAYDGFYTSPYEKVVRSTPVLFMHSAGNDGASGDPKVFLSAPYYPHQHVDDNGDIIKGETFCISPNGSGTDCQVPCTQTPGHCEQKHPLYGPFTTIGPTGSLKDVIVVGAVDSNGNIAGFSSRGPTLDGRVKPDIVAKGLSQYSTLPGASYGRMSGTSMSSPVVTGISALITEQWRRTYGGNPLPVTVKALLIDGADDLGNPGPDYTFGFGLANAQAAVDLIIADNKTGSRIRTGDIAQGQTVQIPLTLTASQKLRVVVAWPDPEVLLGPDDLADKTLVNNLDLKVIDPTGATVLPYILDKGNPSAPATQGVNSVDNVEEVEIANAAPGDYQIVLSGTAVATGPTQQYALIANAALGGLTVACNDAYEPNDSESAAFGYLVNRETVSAATCTATDVDYYSIRTTAAGGLSVQVTATDTPLEVTISGNGITPLVTTIASGTTAASVVTNAAPGVYLVRVETNGALGSGTHAYTLVPTFTTTNVIRRRSTRH